jgi:FkbM family methyltransferase
MRVSRLDYTIARTIYVDGSFEPEELAYIRAVLHPGDVALDVGANIGVHTVTMAYAVGTNGKVHAFEPTMVFDRLSDNVTLNGFQDRVVANSCAVARAEGWLTLAECVPGFEAYTSESHSLSPEFMTGRTLKVPAVTLDAYARRTAIERIDLLKLDVEGGEVNVLRGAAELLGRRAIRCIMTEVNETCLGNSGTGAPELIQQLTEAGFALRELKRGTGEWRPLTTAPHGDWTTLVGKLEP